MYGITHLYCMDIKKRFEVKFQMQENGSIEKAIFIDGEKFDYSIDKEMFAKMKSMGAEWQMAAQKDIEKHFVKCLSEVIGRELTQEDVVQAIKTGWI